MSPELILNRDIFIALIKSSCVGFFFSEQKDVDGLRLNFSRFCNLCTHLDYIRRLEIVRPDYLVCST